MLRGHNIMKKIIPILIFALLIIFSACDDDGIDNESAPDILTGIVQLENMANHSGVRVELVEISTSLLTDMDGTYHLPENLAEGEWTLQASYPFFSLRTETFVMQSGAPADEIEPMKLSQRVHFYVSTDRENYGIGETVEITLDVLNMEDEAVTLSSLTSPQAAFAVRKDDVTVVGALLPGLGEESQSVTIEPGDEFQTTLSWVLDNNSLEPGEYHIYAVLSDNENYPNYFNPDEDLMTQFNESLFSKLVPAVVNIQ